MKYLDEAIKARGIRRIAFLHTDHFEPWRDGITERHADEIARFGEMMDALDYASHMSLFYRSHVPYGALTSPEATATGWLCHHDDRVLFRDRTASEIEIARGAMQSLLRGRSFDVQVHIHHEGFTTSEKLYPAIDSALRDTTPERDAARMEMALQLALDAIREETGLPLDHWAFVHGNWALNASDPEICRIESELEILRRNGCIADFTFPAGRRRCNPTLFKTPFTCTPVDIERCYDVEASDPKAVVRGGGVFASDRMLIWSSEVNHPYCSLDYYSSSSDRVFEDTDETLRLWVEKSPVVDSTLYIKTHAHSMYKAYWDTDGPITPPLATDSVKRIMGQLSELAGRGKFVFEPVTADMAWRELAMTDMKAPASFLGFIGDKFRRVLGSEIQPARPAALPQAARIGVRRNGFAKRSASVGPSGAAIKVGQSTPSMDNRSKLEQLNTLMNRFMSDRIEAMGEVESGAYGYYVDRVEKAGMLPGREMELAVRVHGLIGEGTAFEAGAGVATLPLAIRRLGHPVVVVEQDRRRAAAAAAMFEFVESAIEDFDWPASRILVDKFPSSSTLHLRRTETAPMLIATNFIGTMTDEQEAAIIEEIGGFDSAIIDLHRLRVKRSSADERGALAARIAAAGFEKSSDFYSGTDFEYRLFSN
jgi:hypothetical protein